MASRFNLSGDWPDGFGAMRALSAAVDDAAKEQFGDHLPKLVFAIATINSWNRLTVAAGSPVGGYRSPHAPSETATA